MHMLVQTSQVEFNPHNSGQRKSAISGDDSVGACGNWTKKGNRFVSTPSKEVPNFYTEDLLKFNCFLVWCCDYESVFGEMCLNLLLRVSGRKFKLLRLFLELKSRC
jgi:hypothetical protein